MTILSSRLDIFFNCFVLSTVYKQDELVRVSPVGPSTGAVAGLAVGVQSDTDGNAISNAFQ